MTGEKKNIEFIDEKLNPKKTTKGGGLMDLLNGNILSRKSVASQIPYVIFLAFLAIFYIANRYRFEKMMRHSQEMQIEVRNLRAESITTAAQLMNISKQSQVARMVEEKGLGLQESVSPPKKIKGSVQ